MNAPWSAPPEANTQAGLRTEPSTARHCKVCTRVPSAGCETLATDLMTAEVRLRRVMLLNATWNWRRWMADVTYRRTHSSLPGKGIPTWLARSSRKCSRRTGAQEARHDCFRPFRLKERDCLAGPPRVLLNSAYSCRVRPSGTPESWALYIRHMTRGFMHRGRQKIVVLGTSFVCLVWVDIQSQMLLIRE